MKFLTVLAFLTGLLIAPLLAGQSKRATVVATVPDEFLADHAKIEQLQQDVAALQATVRALTQKYDTHTHRLPGVGLSVYPRLLDCNNPTQLCRQIGSDSLVVMSWHALARPDEKVLTAPPGP